jgi:hypothetical protein
VTSFFVSASASSRALAMDALTSPVGAAKFCQAPIMSALG